MVLARVPGVMHWYYRVIYAYGACGVLDTHTRGHVKRYTCVGVQRVHYVPQRIIKQPQKSSGGRGRGGRTEAIKITGNFSARVFQN